MMRRASLVLPFVTERTGMSGKEVLTLALDLLAMLGAQQKTEKTLYKQNVRWCYLGDLNT